jgi:Zn-dependent M28 family amino/carboxypeptidase
MRKIIGRARRRIARLIIFAFVAFIIIKTSTLGWRFWGKSFMNMEKGNTQLVERLKHHVYKLAHQIGERSVFKYEELEEAARYITREFESFGYEVEFQNYSVYGKKTRNIIITREGGERPDEIVIVGAHYDTCFNPGADDNASGIAGLLELARFFSTRDTNRTIKFIAFVNEEPPFFKSKDMGSYVYARQARKNREDIKAVIILESIGYYRDEPNSQSYPPLLGMFYPNRGNFICVVGNFSSRWLVKRIVSIFKKKSQFPIESFIGPSFVPGVDFSDNWSFWQAGYPAVMITDTAFYRNPHYHTDSDTYQTLDYKGLAHVSEGLAGVLIEITK